MNATPAAQPADDPTCIASTQPKPVPGGPRPDWHRPTLTRIEIKRTMLLTSGPVGDLES
jgi:hypothetical protein